MRECIFAAPSPTLSPTDPVPRGRLTLCPGAYVCVHTHPGHRCGQIRRVARVVLPALSLPPLSCRIRAHHQSLTPAEDAKKTEPVSKMSWASSVVSKYNSMCVTPIPASGPSSGEREQKRVCSCVHVSERKSVRMGSTST